MRNLISTSSSRIGLIFAIATTPIRRAKRNRVSWCHGARGIGLNPLRAYEVFGWETLREEAEIAVRTTGPTLSFRAIPE